MPTYRVTVCTETWKYYHVEVAAPDEDQARSQAMRVVAEQDLEPYTTDCGETETHDCEEITE